jgi:hypothetical protein
MFANVSARSARWSSLLLLATTMSSTYVNIFLPTCPSSTVLVSREKVDPAFLSPSGVLDEAICAEGCYEAGAGLVLLLHIYLMVTREAVEE